MPGNFGITRQLTNSLINLFSTMKKTYRTDQELSISTISLPLIPSPIPSPIQSPILPFEKSEDADLCIFLTIVFAGYVLTRC